jgi:PadR family transcriptional regulator PadR
MTELLNNTAVRSEAETWAAQLRKGSLELALLATLWHEPLYGLEILRRLKASGLTVAEGTLYAILNRLRSEALVASEWRDAGSGHPRKYYTLTESGRASTKNMAAVWQEFSGRIDTILQPVISKEVKNASTK